MRLLSFCESGSLIDVSGASGEIDLPAGGTLGSHARTCRLRSPAMAAPFRVKGQGLIEGTWRGQAGGSGARGGALTLSSATAPLILSETAAAAGRVGLASVSPSIVRLRRSHSQCIVDVRLEGVDLTLGGSISIGGALVNGNGTSSRLSAPIFRWCGTSCGAPTSRGHADARRLPHRRQAGASIRGFEQSVLEASDIRLDAATVLGPAGLARRRRHFGLEGRADLSGLADQRDDQSQRQDRCPAERRRRSRACRSAAP